MTASGRQFFDRAGDSFWTVDKQTVTKLREDVETKDRAVTDFSHLITHQYRRAESGKLNKRASEILNKIDIGVKSLRDAEKRRTLEWLSSSSKAPPDKQQELRSKIDRDALKSGQWLLDSDVYSDWQKDPHSFLWLYGASGCGKSCLCSTIIKDLLESSARNDDTVVVYWYFDNGESRTQNLQDLLRFFLRQISARTDPFPSIVQDLAERHELSNSNPDIATLFKALMETVSSLGINVFFVFDAIDEYRAGDETLRAEFLDILVKLTDAKITKLHLLVTGIQEEDIQKTFDRLEKSPTKLNIEKLVSEDLDAYLRAKIDRYAEDKPLWDTEIKSKIEKTLKADGCALL